MLPGFRFLFAAILLSTSILVFGLGAAALLRTTHEQYVSNPSWRNGPQEQVFAQAAERVQQPVLAAFRAEASEPAAAEPTPSLRDKVPTIALPETEPEQVAAVTAEASAQPEPQVADAAPAAEAPPTAQAPAAELAKAETAPPAPADTLTPADTTASLPEDKPAAAAEAQPAEPATAPASPAIDIATASVAALDDPATTAWKDSPAKAKTDAKADSSTPESKASKPRAHKVKKQRRIVRRPPPPQQVQQTYYFPFVQQQPTLAATAARPR
ncbi:hypothetical protein AYJ54_44090 [Bradyrhizobium centrolobii]|uniref:Uncharacterized protein n=2 Tax=Bradyrhizobium centrolobii TaxID=1505087 RepID=A0A176YZH7_9BRAD|nr:hypothetical protein [Bradyrhizobium centrolobii]OAF13321.1 hypothetical protein AYJ54_44090 [Bradyrhizobium centrolobii]